jgi:hypothetical protein
MMSKNYLATAMATFAAATLQAATFNAGSDGSLGVVVINENTTLDLPPDGRLKFITLTVNAGRTLTFNKNALNTPVRILAQSNIVVNGSISVAGGNTGDGAPGRGGPGGFDGGFGGFGLTGNTSIGGDGTGPGRGRNVAGAPYPYQHSAAFVDAAGLNLRTNGNALNVPLMGGSGGAGNDGNPGRGGGGGGGAILLASDTKITLNGTITATGGNGAGGGSGGSIRLVSPVVDGTGTFNVTGGGGFWVAGSQGRVRIDCEDRYAFRGLRFQGRVSQGSQMFVDPENVPVLNITSAAGQAIPVPAVGGVQVTLPAGSSGNRQVTVAASGFTANVPISIVVTPETGPSSTFDAEIPISGGSGQVTVDVVLPVGNVSQIHAWTR